MILRRAEPYARVIIPDLQALRVGTLRQILGEAGISAERLIEAVYENGMFQPLGHSISLTVNTFRLLLVRCRSNLMMLPLILSLGNGKPLRTTRSALPKCGGHCRRFGVRWPTR